MIPLLIQNASIPHFRVRNITEGTISMVAYCIEAVTEKSWHYWGVRSMTSSGAWPKQEEKKRGGKNQIKEEGKSV